MSMESEVKRLWPDASIQDGWNIGGRRHFRVTIKPGRYAFGIQKRWAWAAAWDSITQDEELSRGAPKTERSEVPRALPEGSNPRPNPLLNPKDLP